jgi:streptogramin lyase
MSVDTNPAQSLVPVGLRRNRTMLFALALIVATVVAGAGWYGLRPSVPNVVEYKMLEQRDIPTALAVAPDGTVWFTIDFSNAVGRLRNGKIERLPKQSNNVDALGIGVDANGNAWFADAPAIAILRISPGGELKSFLRYPIARLGRLAVRRTGRLVRRKQFLQHHAAQGRHPHPQRASIAAGGRTALPWRAMAPSGRRSRGKPGGSHHSRRRGDRI